MTERDVKSMQIDNDVFVINGDELYELKLNGTQRYLIKLAKLGTNSSNAILMFDVVICHNGNVIVILAKQNFFEVFEISKIGFSEANPIQKITTSGGFQGSKAIRQDNGEIILITATYMSKIASMLR